MQISILLPATVRRLGRGTSLLRLNLSPWEICGFYLLLNNRICVPFVRRNNDIVEKMFYHLEMHAEIFGGEIL